MKKIMFNDKYGLTNAVLGGRKTQTRRIARVTDYEADAFNGKFKDNRAGSWGAMTQSRYKVSEIVAVAEEYMFIYVGYEQTRDKRGNVIQVREHKGWRNKMFVKAKFMRHQIKITNIRLERLQDISEADCLAEGVKRGRSIGYYVEGIYPDKHNGSYTCTDDCRSFRLFPNPKEAYAALIDKISGKGTWDSNPWVWVYDFELIK